MLGLGLSVALAGAVAIDEVQNDTLQMFMRIKTMQ
jgi:hypothetical protein